MKHTIASTLLFLSLGLHAAESKLTLRNREAKGIGYDKGYTTVDYLFLHSWQKPELLFNLRGHFFNDGRFAGNVGLGYRHAIKSDTYKLGVNLFYDCRDSEHLFTNQLGAGLEFLSSHIDLRMNGYLPLGNDKTFEKRTFERFSGNNVIVKQKLIGALPSAEIEMGFFFNSIFYLAGGPYYLFKQPVKGIDLGKSWGEKLRISIEMSRYFTLGGIVTHDHIFKTTVQGYLSLNIPLGRSWGKDQPKRNLNSVPVFRNEIIPLEKKKRHVRLSSGQEEDDLINLVFVNNMAPEGGNGSIEAPFVSLKEAEMKSAPGDVIYVFPGDGTSRNMEEGIVLKEDQIIASSAAPLKVEEVIIPAMTPGELPVIINIHPDEPIITNPGESHLEDFNIIDPWAYFFDIWGSLPDDGYKSDFAGNEDLFPAQDGVDVAINIDDNVSETDSDVSIAVVSEQGSDTSFVEIPEPSALPDTNSESSFDGGSVVHEQTPTIIDNHFPPSEPASQDQHTDNLDTHNEQSFDNGIVVSEQDSNVAPVSVPQDQHAENLETHSDPGSDGVVVVGNDPSSEVHGQPSITDNHFPPPESSIPDQKTNNSDVSSQHGSEPGMADSPGGDTASPAWSDIDWSEAAQAVSWFESNQENGDGTNAPETQKTDGFESDSDEE